MPCEHRPVPRLSRLQLPARLFVLSQAMGTVKLKVLPLPNSLSIMNSPP